MEHIKKHLGFAGLLKTMASRIQLIEDTRQRAKVDYRLHDCVMSAFAMMYLQDPSILAFQRRIQDRIQRNNLNTIFGVNNIPKDSQFRNVLDTLSIEVLSPIFADFLCALQRGKHLAKYQLLQNDQPGRVHMVENPCNQPVLKAD